MLPTRILSRYSALVADLIPLGPLGPTLHRELRDLLQSVRLSEPNKVFRSVMDDDLLPELPDTALVDGAATAYTVACHIAEGLFVGNGLQTVHTAMVRLCLRVAEDTTDSNLRSALRDWAHNHHVPTQQQRRPTAMTRTGTIRRNSSARVSIRVDRSGGPTQEVLVNVLVQLPDGRFRSEFDDRMPARRLQPFVETLIPAVINRCVPIEAEVLIEFILPRRWLSKPVDEWTLGPSLVKLGWRHPVVVRDRGRFEQAVVDRELIRRWAGFESKADMSMVEWISCSNDLSAKQIAATLAANKHIAMLAITYSPMPTSTHPALRAGFDSGIPVMLWRRTRCDDEHNNSHTCNGSQFQREIDAMLIEQFATASLGELVERVRALRADAGVNTDNDSHAGRALTLMWDPPEPPTRLPQLEVARDTEAST